MKGRTYFSMLFLVLVQLAVLLLHLDKVSGIVQAFESLVALGFVFIAIIFLYGYKAEWSFISTLGTLLFCFSLLNNLFLYYFVRGAIMLFVGEMAAIISLIIVTSREEEPVKVREEISAPEIPKVEIIPQDEKPAKTPPRKFVGSKNGKTFHRKSCVVAKKIPRKNRVYFKDKTEAHKLKYKEHKCVK